MGFVEPTSGSCTVFGEAAGTTRGKAKIGYLPEVAMYYPFLTPLETLKLYGQLQGLRGRSLKQEAEQLLDRVGLSGSMRKQNRQLSKGMLQRVGIAQSLLGSPPLLVLDEVTSGLDPVGRRDLREILRERQRAGTTLFFSSHELAEIDMLCDRILLINKGALVEERNVRELKESVRRYEIRYSGSASLVGLTEDWRQEGLDFIAKFEDKPRLVAALERIQQSNCKLIDVVAQEGSLEEYFIETIGRAA
jgi:ABC-2 type transport system ATP-binding protein